jgi:hypothetical protein
MIENEDSRARAIHFYNFEECETLCGIDSPSPDEIVEDDAEAEVTCPKCLEILKALHTANKIRDNYAVTGGRDGFLSDPGGWMSLLDLTDDDDLALAAINIIRGESADEAAAEDAAYREKFDDTAEAAEECPECKAEAVTASLAGSAVVVMPLADATAVSAALGAGEVAILVTQDVINAALQEIAAASGMPIERVRRIHDAILNGEVALGAYEDDALPDANERARQRGLGR